MNIIKETVRYINEGNVILYPTDTIWGLGCDPFNYDAITKILKIKHRSSSKGFILLLNKIEALSRYVVKLPKNIYDILNSFNIPTTIIFNNPKNLPNYITNNNSVAFRVVKDDFCNQIINAINKPLLSTSANISNHPSPNNKLSSVSEEIKNSVDYIAMVQNNTATGIASNIVAIKDDGTFTIIRN